MATLSSPSPASIRLEIITPEATVYDAHVASVTLPTGNGEITVLPHHIPLLSTVEPGSLIARERGTEHLFAVSRGTVEIDGSGVRVLVRFADSAEKLEDEEAILRATKRAEELMRSKREDAESFAEVTAVLDKELAKLRSVRRRSTMRRSPSQPSTSS